MTTHLIVGTAGHVDHGKTLLVKALTGIDSDRLPEEKRRGMSIDLGFGCLELGPYRLGIVDVPGHERFIRNMLAGAMAVDLAMLVVAASESVKPQTREHLEILRHVGVEQGVVVLTKCDLVDPEWLALVEEEVRELASGSFLRQAPMVRVSSVTGAGVPELSAALARAAERAAASPRQTLVAAPFRMAIDRAFSVAGHGTVVTGSVASGRLACGEEVAVEPRGAVARARSLQSHGAAVDAVQRGQRAAINLAGVRLEEIRRGDVLAEPGFLAASRRLRIALSLAPEHASLVRRKMPVRVHLGTADFPATMRLLEPVRNADGDRAVLAEIQLSAPAACVWGEPLVVRRESPSTTLGGGRVVDPVARPLGRRDEAALPRLRQLASADPLARASAATYFNGLAGFDAQNTACRAGVTDAPSRLLERLVDARQVETFALPGGRTAHLHVEVVERLMARVEQLLDKEHRRHPLQAAFPPAVLQRVVASDGAAGILDGIVERMEAAGRLVVIPAGVALPGYRPRLSRAQRRLYRELIEAHRRAGCAPPTLKELAAGAAPHQAAIPELVELAVAEGYLVRVCADWCLHGEVARHVYATLRRHIGDGSFAVRDLRDLLHTSRKYLVPLCEYLDRIGFTRREGDLRRIVAPDAVESATMIARL